MRPINTAAKLQSVCRSRFRAGRPALLVVCLVLLAGLLTNRCWAAELQIGQSAPDFTLPDENGKPHHLADYVGRTVVLMFYPKDFTPG